MGNAYRIYGSYPQDTLAHMQLEGDEDFNKQSLKLSGSHTEKGEFLTYEKNIVRALIMFGHWYRKYF